MTQGLNISTKNFSAQNFYTSGTIDGNLGNFGGILVGDGAVSGTSVQNGQGSYLVVERVTSQFTLRSGEEVACVFNETRPMRKTKKK